MSILDSKAELRGAIRRIIEALQGNTVDVKIHRRDLELVMALASTKLERPVVMPLLHPDQR